MWEVSIGGREGSAFGSLSVEGVHDSSTRRTLEQIPFHQQHKFLEVTEPLQQGVQGALKTEFNKTNTLYII